MRPPLPPQAVPPPVDTARAAPEPAVDTAAADALAGPPPDTLAAAPDSVEAPPSLVEAVRRALTGTDSAQRAAATSTPGADPKEPPGVFDSTLGWLTEAFHDATGLAPATARGVLLTLALVLGLWAVRGLALALVNRRTRDVRIRYQWRKWTGYASVVVGVAVLFRIWVGSLGSLATFLGLLSAGLAIALRDPLVNLAGWVFIVWKRPFGPGDRITIRTHTGDVIDQRVFQFTLLEVGTATGAYQSTGRIIHVPNGWVFMDSVVNFTRGFPYVWHEVPVRVTFESDWRAAKRLVQEVAAEHANPLSADAERTLRRAAQEYMIFYSKLTPTVYTAVREWGVELTLRYLVEPRRVRGSEQAIWEALLDAFGAHERIDFAYNTSRVVRTTEEGKPALRYEPAEGHGGPSRSGDVGR
jgi:small-conductance mechanosensitive channel